MNSITLHKRFKTNVCDVNKYKLKVFQGEDVGESQIFDLEIPCNCLGFDIKETFENIFPLLLYFILSICNLSHNFFHQVLQ